jgi:hypothetical protein
MANPKAKGEPQGVSLGSCTQLIRAVPGGLPMPSGYLILCTAVIDLME